MTDIFTRQVEARPLIGTTSRHIADVLVDEIFCQYGAPEQLLTDQGANMSSALIKDVLNAMGVRKIQTSACNPR